MKRWQFLPLVLTFQTTHLNISSIIYIIGGCRGFCATWVRTICAAFLYRFTAAFTQQGFVQFAPHFLTTAFLAQHGFVQFAPHFFNVAFLAQHGLTQFAPHFLTSVFLEHQPHEEHPAILPAIKSIAPTTIPTVKNLNFILSFLFLLLVLSTLTYGYRPVFLLKINKKTRKKLLPPFLLRFLI
ncbi:MAG: hypothetical protein L3J71_05235 [Victivallaceae bacterium]|nr:hypothetical protein [Victivallaceae bacterium]